MKHLKSFNESIDTNNRVPTFTKELYETFSNLIHDPEIVSIPYLYTCSSVTDFHIYFLYGERIENDDHEFLRELYGLRDIINNIYNKEYFHVTLKSGKGIIVLYDYKMTVHTGSPDYRYSYKSENYFTRLKDMVFYKKIPDNIYNLIKTDCSRSELISGIHTDHGSSNLSLFDWIYEK